MRINGDIKVYNTIFQSNTCDWRRKLEEIDGVQIAVDLKNEGWM
jgi:hypothetical protein